MSSGTRLVSCSPTYYTDSAFLLLTIHVSVNSFPADCSLINNPIALYRAARIYRAVEVNIARWFHQLIPSTAVSKNMTLYLNDGHHLLNGDIFEELRLNTWDVESFSIQHTIQTHHSLKFFVNYEFGMPCSQITSSDCNHGLKYP